MFDPTAFENLKIVIEGAVYDKDLGGEILVIDRNEIINMAKLERSFDITFIEQNSGGKEIKALWILEAKIENLAAELLESALSDTLAGSHVTVKFECEHANDPTIYKKIKNVLGEIWGAGRTIEQRIEMNPFHNKENIINHITVNFNRLVHEDQIADLTLMVDFMIKSIRELKKIFK